MITLLLLLNIFLFSNGSPLSGKQTLYDENLARQLLNLAAAAYGTEHNGCLNRTFPSHEMHLLVSTIKENCDHLDNTCESFIVSSQNKRELNIVFRGTKTKAQLLLEGWDSIQPGVDFFDMGNVNRYFLNAHLVLWPDVERILRNPAYKDYNVVFTGHSLGGALASLAAARTVKQGYRRGDQIKLLTFGQPRVGTLEYARNFDAMIPYSFRVVFRRDIVPHLPACHKVSNGEGVEDESKPCDSTANDKSYHHGTEIWYPDSMEPGSHYLECTGHPKNEDFACSDRIKFHYDQTSSYIWDHRHYFGVKVTSYGKAGCDATLKEGKPGVFEQVACWFSKSPDCEEHTLSPDKEIEVVPWEVLNAKPATFSPLNDSTASIMSIISLIVALFMSL